MCGVTGTVMTTSAVMSDPNIVTVMTVLTALNILIIQIICCPFIILPKTLLGDGHNHPTYTTPTTPTTYTTPTTHITHTN